MRLEELRALALFDGLGDDQLGELLHAGSEVPITVGVDLFREGDPADFWWLLVDGAVDLVRRVGRDETVVGRMDVPGRWAGGFRAWDEHGRYLATGRGAAVGRLLQVPAEDLRDRMSGWFPFGVHLIKGVFGTARTIESTVRQRESLVALGALAAGLAHELNNPAAAAGRAAAALDEACGAMAASFADLVEARVTPDQLGALESLRAELRSSTAAADPLTVAEREDTVIGWLEDRGVERPWLLGPTLSAAGADVDWCDRAAEVLDGPVLGSGIRWMASRVSVASLLSEVRESTRRVSELVGAVKSYSQMDRASRQEVDVTEGLESTLVMLGHKLRDGVTVVRDYAAGLPKVSAYPGELNQVWTNLVDNAVEAMEGHGRLRVTASSDATAVVVEIADTGPGMPPEVAARAFDAFYTTKDVGTGTGLGLDIARRIVVERHGGSIDIDARPGETVLRVRIPVRHD